jgi:hypothetical protein
MPFGNPLVGLSCIRPEEADARLDHFLNRGTWLDCMI